MKEKVNQLNNAAKGIVKIMAMFTFIGAGCTLIVFGTMAISGLANVTKK